MRRPLPLAAALPALVLALALSACTGAPSDSASSPRAAPRPRPSPAPTSVPGGLGPEFFGMHDSDPVGSSWPAGPVGSLRVWDAGVAWNQVETAPGRYDFSRLDAIVTTARAHRARLLIVLGQTPAFYARTPKRVGAYGPGASSMPDLAAWSSYVAAVVARYNAPDVAFQVWNEANVAGYWSGTYRQMARLTAAARAVVDGVTPRPTLVAPAMAVRLSGQRAGLRDLYAQKIDGTPVGDLVDVVSLQLYPEDGQGLERKVALLAQARRILDLQGVPGDKPVWDTEINYGLRGGEPATPAAPEQQMANVAMTYLLDAADGVARVYWYAWDLQTIANTTMTTVGGSAPGPGGRAFAVVRRWLLGTRVDGCSPADRDAVWVCTLEAPAGARRVYWSPSGSATVRTSFDATSAEILGQPARRVPLGGTTLQVGSLPVMVSSTRASQSSMPPTVRSPARPTRQ